MQCTRTVSELELDILNLQSATEVCLRYKLQAMM
jgi:hypothetical protein